MSTQYSEKELHAFASAMVEDLRLQFVESVLFEAIPEAKTKFAAFFEGMGNAAGSLPVGNLKGERLTPDQERYVQQLVQIGIDVLLKKHNL